METKHCKDRADDVDKPTHTSGNGMAEQHRAVHHDIERQDAMINDLIQLTRLQNTEINNLRQEVRRISASAAAAAAEKDDGLRAEVDELKRQISALRSEQHEEKDSRNSGDNTCTATTPTKLTRKAHVAIRDPQTVKDRIIAAVRENVTAQTLELEQKQGTDMLAINSHIHGLEMIMSSVLSGIGCLYKTLVPPSETRHEVSSIKHYYDDLDQQKADVMEKLDMGSELTLLSKQQVLLQHQFSALSTALDQRISAATKKQSHHHVEENQSANMQKQIVKLSKTVDSQLQVISNHNLSIGSHSEEIGKIQNCLSSLQAVLELFEKTKQDSDGLKSRMSEVEQKVANNTTFSAPPYSPAWRSSTGGRSTLYQPHDDSAGKASELTTGVESQKHALEELAQRVLVVENLGRKHTNTLFSDGTDLAILQQRLSHTETLIGRIFSQTVRSPRLYPTIRGQSFHEDATSLRFIGRDDESARDKFYKFYGNRAEAARFVEIAPRAVILAFNAIARVRSSGDDEMGDEMRKGSLVAVQHVAEGIVDSWEKTLPLHEGDEHVPCNNNTTINSDGALAELQLLCRRANVDLGPEPGLD
ncbi:hypothetical protein PISL3812_03318 [Talaromyces islandicus]|uniref:Uncharacterized protein n=1 Tax=Talaromyces islandicus TaxID=28573 RepID=A0A0U1LSE8_TALIS|nr:hypothetical protein PISL3812_03318 [Talaromyces islandicus]